MKGKIGLLVVMLSTITSCDPAHSLTVVNATSEEKYLEVVGIHRNSISLSKVTHDERVKQVDTVAVKSNDFERIRFTFLLPPKHKALLEFGFGSRPATNEIIINGTDTVVVNKSAGRVKKKPYHPIGGDYVLTLK
jgi:hypothetical protein